MMSSLGDILLDVQSPEHEKRTTAERKLANAERENFAEYCKALCAELCSETAPEFTRQTAGILLKNAISGTDARTDALRREKYLSTLANEDRQELKQKLAKLMAAEEVLQRAQDIGSQIAAKIARLEIPQNTWLEYFPLIQSLIASSNVKSKVAACNAIAYLTEDSQTLSDQLNRDLLSDESKTFILSQLSLGITSSFPEVKVAALKAFYYAVLFADRFMANDPDRRNLFRLVGECLNDPREEVELAAWEVLLQIANEYYEYLSEYLPVLSELTIERMRKGSQAIGISAIEFWSTICDEELLIIQNESSKKLMKYVHHYRGPLLQVLFESIIHKGEEEPDPDDWTLSMAAATCVGLCSQILGNDIIAPALQFIDVNFSSLNWAAREAAVLVYGSVLEGPDTSSFETALKNSFPSLCQILQDPSPAVRDTAAWTLGRIAQFHLKAIADRVPELINVLIPKLTSDEPRVSKNVCYALYSVISEAETYSGLQDLIQSHFMKLADALVSVAKRPDASECQLRQTAYNTLYILVEQMKPDEVLLNAVSILLGEFTNWIEETLRLPHSDELAQIQAPMIGCINVLIRRLESRCLPLADRLFVAFLRVVESDARRGPTGDLIGWGDTTEEVLLAISSMAYALQGNFDNFLTHLTPLLTAALKHRRDTKVCGIAIDIMGALASVTTNFATYERALVVDLFHLLQDPETPMILKPKAVIALSDFALMTPQTFAPHLRELFDFLRQAGSARVEQGPPGNDEWADYIHELRDAALVAYSSTIVCVRDCGDVDRSIFGGTPARELLENEVTKILEFVTLIVNDLSSSNSNIKNAIIIVQDLIPLFKEPLVRHLNNLPMYALLKDRAQSSPSAEIKRECTRLEELMGCFGN